MADISKVYISADRERSDCWALSAKICEQEQPFDLVIGLTRGGGPVGFYIQEFFMAYWNRKVGYANLRTRSYDDIASAGKVEIGSFDEVLAELGAGTRILVADDIFDRGKTAEAVCAALRERIPESVVKVATLYYKPENSQVDMKPDFYGTIFAGDQWVVFPRSITEADGVEGLMEMGLSPQLAETIEGRKIC